MTKLMESAAVGQRTGKDAAEILQSYIATGPAMVFNHTQETPHVRAPSRGPDAGGNRR
ncbi:MAG: hypothetical protein K8R48_07155 [Alphaproteobacteria bacterium]|nr:hypothetical protein [Alphaproteobacteria bacterium]